MSDFFDQYKHPNWQKKRLEVLSERGYQCEECGDDENQLHVHHLIYEKGHKIWDYENYKFAVLCESCHLETHRLRDNMSVSIARIGLFNQYEFANLLDSISKLAKKNKTKFIIDALRNVHKYSEEANGAGNE